MCTLCCFLNKLLIVKKQVLFRVIATEKMKGLSTAVAVKNLFIGILKSEKKKSEQCESLERSVVNGFDPQDE